MTTQSLIIVPRERASVAVASLRSIYQNTEIPFDLVYVDCMLYGDHRNEVRQIVEAHGGLYIHVDKWLYPNQARNVGGRHAQGDYLVFVDNDILVEKGWLKTLVHCAEETGAGIVGPLYLEGDQDDPIVHCAGGRIKYKDCDDGIRKIIVRQHGLGKPLAQMPELKRKPTGLVEFHTVLVSRDCYNAMNGVFDEKLLTTREHVDLCLSAKGAGFEVYFEPASRARYGRKEPMTARDLDYFLFRWSKQATRQTIAYFEEKWAVRLDSRRERIIRRRRSRAISSVSLEDRS